jgi:chaperone modulatory protein CbpM
MKPLDVEWLWLDARESLTIEELSRACGLSVDELAEVIEYGALHALAPFTPQGQKQEHNPGRFSAEWVVPLRAVSRLRQDFDLDVFTVGLLLGYLDRIDKLELEVQSLLAKH